METKLSPVELENFAIRAFNWQCVVKNDKTISLPDIPIDIDFNIYQSTNDSNRFKVAMVISSSDLFNEESDSNRPGYHFSVLAEGYYKITDENVDENEKNVFISYSVIPMMINSIRIFLMNHSSYSLYGQWRLPIIDLKDLIDKKQKEGQYS